MADRIVLCLIVSFTSLVACDQGDPDSGRVADASNQQNDDDAQPDKPDFDFTAFNVELESFLADNDLVGASAAIVHKDYGIVYEKGYGEFAADRVYLIASSSKIISAGIVMRLADQRLLDIDASISDYLGDWGIHKEGVKVAQLLSNSSGLVSLTDNPSYAHYMCQYLNGGTLSECAKTIYTADDSDDRISPDTEFHYGGGQWQLSGGIAEVVSGKTFAELVDETYARPCDTASIGYTNQYQRMFIQAVQTGNQEVALAYPSFFEGNAANLDATDNPSVEGGGYLTASDYGKILLMHLRGGLCDKNRVLSEASVTRMQEDRIAKVYNGSTGNQSLEGYGLGWWIDRDNAGVVMDGGAYGAIPWLDTSRGYGAVVLMESNETLGGQLFRNIKPLADAVFEKIER